MSAIQTGVLQPIEALDLFVDHVAKAKNVLVMRMAKRDLKKAVKMLNLPCFSSSPKSSLRVEGSQTESRSGSCHTLLLQSFESRKADIITQAQALGP